MNPYQYYGGVGQDVPAPAVVAPPNFPMMPPAALPGMVVTGPAGMAYPYARGPAVFPVGPTHPVLVPGIDVAPAPVAVRPLVGAASPVALLPALIEECKKVRKHRCKTICVYPPNNLPVAIRDIEFGHDIKHFRIHDIKLGMQSMMGCQHISGRFFKHRGRHHFRFRVPNVTIDLQHPLVFSVENKSHHDERFSVRLIGEYLAT